MRELSLNVLDVAQNSISAGAKLIELLAQEDTAAHTLRLVIRDNGRGMTPEQVAQVRDPFFTTRTTRKVGMGIPLFEMAAQMSGGSLSIESAVGKGTCVTADFHTDSVDFVPLGDMCATVVMLIQMNTDRDFVYSHRVDDREFTVDTRQLKEILGDVPLDEPSVVQWIREYITEQMQMIRGGVSI